MEYSIQIKLGYSEQHNRIDLQCSNDILRFSEMKSSKRFKKAGFTRSQCKKGRGSVWQVSFKTLHI